MKKDDEKQGSLFSEETGSPLFSNSPMRATENPFVPEPVTKQKSLFGQPTMDSMQSAAQRKVCPFCQQLVMVAKSGRLTEHGPDGKPLQVFEKGQKACFGTGYKT